MEKVREVTKTTIEICRNCQGSGTVPDETGTSSAGVCTCPVCLGGGRVLKKLDITITITPYKRGQ